MSADDICIRIYNARRFYRNPVLIYFRYHIMSILCYHLEIFILRRHLRMKQIKLKKTLWNNQNLIYKYKKKLVNKQYMSKTTKEGWKSIHKQRTLLLLQFFSQSLLFRSIFFQFLLFYSYIYLLFYLFYLICL